MVLQASELFFGQLKHEVFRKAAGSVWADKSDGALGGEDPDKPFTGKFVVRISPELHRKIYLSARLSNESINAWLNEKLDRVVNEELKEYKA